MTFTPDMLDSAMVEKATDAIIDAQTWTGAHLSATEPERNNARFEASATICAYLNAAVESGRARTGTGWPFETAAGGWKAYSDIHPVQDHEFPVLILRMDKQS